MFNIFYLHLHVMYYKGSLHFFYKYDNISIFLLQKTRKIIHGFSNLRKFVFSSLSISRLSSLWTKSSWWNKSTGFSSRIIYKKIVKFTYDFSCFFVFFCGVFFSCFFWFSFFYKVSDFGVKSCILKTALFVVNSYLLNFMNGRAYKHSLIQSSDVFCLLICKFFAFLKKKKQF